MTTTQQSISPLRPCDPCPLPQSELSATAASGVGGSVSVAAGQPGHGPYICAATGDFDSLAIGRGPCDTVRQPSPLTLFLANGA